MLSIFKRSVQLFVSICLVVTLGGCSLFQGGPSESVVKKSLAAMFQPGLEDYMELKDFSTTECELTENDKANKDLDERWVARFKLMVEVDGEQREDKSIQAVVMERNNDGDWYVNFFKIFGC